MNTVERVDLQKDKAKWNTDIYQHSFVLPSQSIINHDLTPLKFSDISNGTALVESEKVPLFVENLIDFHKDDDKMMTVPMSTHAASNIICAPADKHAQISPNEYNAWIRVHTSDNIGCVSVFRQRSVLSTLSFDAADVDSNSSSGSTSDEYEDPVTPTTIALPDMLKEGQLDKGKEEANKQKKSIALLCRQANYTEKEKPLPLIEEDDHPSQLVVTTQPLVPQLPITMMPRAETKASGTLGADHLSKKDRKSWFSGFLHDLKGTSKPQNPKKAGAVLSGLFSRSSEKQEPTTHTTVNAASLLLSPTKSRTKSKKKKLESPVAKHVESELLPQRYPPNTEYAIYRLSHVKLGNPRRPLQQQVVISNMMYWYLSMQQQEQEQQEEEQQQKNYLYSKRKVYFNNIYQATYQSFEPPTPGGGHRQHQPHFYAYPILSHPQQHRNPPTQQTPSHHVKEPYAPLITEKPKNPDTGLNKKNKYKPVRNTEYNPLAF